MTREKCHKPTNGQSCVARLADGWILATDLCPACTGAFMAALDGIDKPLKWHAVYVARVATPPAAPAR